MILKVRDIDVDDHLVGGPRVFNEADNISDYR